MARDGFSQLFFNICVLVGVGCVVCDPIVKAGTEYVLKPEFKGAITSVVWSHQGLSTNAPQVKIVDWDTTNNFFWFNREKQSELNIVNGDLTLRQLQTSDSGQYNCALEVDGTVQKKTLKLLVMGEVSKPEVTCKKNDTHLELLCSLSPPMEAKFKWSVPEGKKEGNRLPLLRSQYSGIEIFFCTAYNEVSEKTEEFVLERCFTAVLPESVSPQSGLGPGGIAGIVIGVLLVLVIGGVIYWKFIRPQYAHMPVSTNAPENSKNPSEPETNLSMTQK